MNRNSIPNFGPLWALMARHRFVPDPDTIYDNFECDLCKKVMVNSCKTPCGCQFCLNCINDHLDNHDQYCPGGRQECRMAPLSQNQNIILDQRTDIKIWNLKVLCPNVNCEYKGKLSKMEDHLRTCVRESSGVDDNDRIYEIVFQLMNPLIENNKNTALEFKSQLKKANETIATQEMELQDKEERISNLERIVCNERQKRMSFERNVNFDRLRVRLDASFIFEFTNVYSSRREITFSDGFYKFGYKFCLGLQVVNSRMSLWCHLKAGMNDDGLEWPMRRRVVLMVIDQRTMEPYRRVTYQYDSYFPKYLCVFNEPRNEIQEGGIGSYSFMKVNDEMDFHAMMTDDCVLAACSIE